MKSSLLIILGFILLSISFYWFQIRPSNIRKTCAKVATEKALEISGTASKGTYSQEAYKVYFSRSLYE